MTTTPLGTTTPVGLSSADLSSMDIETALMAVQMQRANILEDQLKSQMEAVRQRNQHIEALNNILAKVRTLRPNDADGVASTVSAGNVNVPTTTTGTSGVDSARITELEDENAQLQAWLDAQQPGQTPVSGNTPAPAGGGTLTVPSDIKVAPLTANTDARAPYAKAINDLVDARAATPPDYTSIAAGNRSVVDGFAAYHAQYASQFPAPIPANLSLGFNSGSDEGDIARAFENPNVQAAFEVYVRLAYQSGGTPGRPNTPIVAPAGSGNNGGGSGGGSGTQNVGTNGTTTIDGLGPNSSATELLSAIVQRNTEIARLNAAGNNVTSTNAVTSVSMDVALAQYGLTPLVGGSQSQFDALINNITSKIDSFNSSQQMDMLRLQSMTNKRNEAFDIMTNFIKKLQDNRSSIVGNMR